MGRPSLVDARRVEILDAFERCLGHYGLEGSSLERIAEEAGMQRSILRHYVGNREDLVAALCERVVATYCNDLKLFASQIDPTRRIAQVLEYLLPDQPRESTNRIMVVESLIAAAENDASIRDQMNHYVDSFVQIIADQLRLQFPHQRPQKCWQTAYGAICICFNQASLASLGLPARYQRASRQCVERLFDCLSE